MKLKSGSIRNVENGNVKNELIATSRKSCIKANTTKQDPSIHPKKEGNKISYILSNIV